MKKLEELFKITLKKKEEQIYDKNYFLITPSDEIKKYIINEEDDTSVSLNFDFISEWYHFNFLLLFLKEGKVQTQEIVNSTYYAIEANNWEYFLGKKFEQYSEAIQFHSAIKHLAQAMLLGWDKLAVKYGHLLIKMLYGKQYKGWHPVYRHPWFMLELFCKWQNLKLDYSRLNTPIDLNIYNEALENWDTKDIINLSKIVDRLVEFHINESDENEYDNKTPDFPSSNYFVYAIEILMWLNIRQRMGLPDYVITNDLMKLPINNWHTKKTEIPNIELLERAKTKLLKDYPGIEFEI